MLLVVGAGALLLVSLRPLMRAQAEPPRIFPDSGQAVDFAISPRISDLPPEKVSGPAAGRGW